MVGLFSLSNIEVKCFLGSRAGTSLVGFSGSKNVKAPFEGL